MATRHKGYNEGPRTNGFKSEYEWEYGNGNKSFIYIYMPQTRSRKLESSLNVIKIADYSEIKFDIVENSQSMRNGKVRLISSRYMESTTTRYGYNLTENISVVRKRCLRQLKTV